MTTRENAYIQNGDLFLGIELGSTRIKCCLVDPFGNCLETGVYNWDNRYEDGFWTYDLNQALFGIGQCYLDMKKKVVLAHGLKIRKISAIGVSAMMHGLIALDGANRLLTPFRTWRNNNTEDVAQELSKRLNFNIPARWSVAHICYAVQHHEPFAEKTKKMTTLASYIHERLTGRACIGPNDASGMFPVFDGENYDGEMVKKVNLFFAEHESALHIQDILPPIAQCGLPMGTLTEEGALILDPEGDLLPGSIFSAPEGDAATGMVTTNTVKPRSGNISAGTSIFGTFVLDRPLKKAYSEIDVLSSPDGKTVAMIHCNNCTSGINACMNLASETLRLFGVWKDSNEVYQILFESVLDYKGDFSDLLCYNYLSGENITSVENGAMLLAASPNAKLTIPNIMLAQLFASFATFSLGMDILREEKFSINNVFVHGGMFKTKGVAQKVFASIINQEISVNQAASEGGAWGMAILALYLKYRKTYSLEDYLSDVIFKEASIEIEKPNLALSQKFLEFKKSFIACLPAERMIGKELTHKC